jgi:hypothetical protein
MQQRESLIVRTRRSERDFRPHFEQQLSEHVPGPESATIGAFEYRRQIDGRARLRRRTLGVRHHPACRNAVRSAGVHLLGRKLVSVLGLVRQRRSGSHFGVPQQ